MSSPSAVAQQTWTIDPGHSEASFAVKHLMISTVKGNFRNVSGTVVVDESDPAASRVEAVIDAASIDTRQEQRDTHLRSADFFDVEKYPSLTFRSTKVESLGNGQFRVQGDLTIRDVTKPVVLEVEETGRGKDPWGGDRVGYSATTKFDRTDFGLTWNQALEAGGIMVGNEVKVTLDVQAVLA
jgi:polyisoprenoid-binding protein YceI